VRRIQRSSLSVVLLYDPVAVRHWRPCNSFTCLLLPLLTDLAVHTSIRMISFDYMLLHFRAPGRSSLTHGVFFPALLIRLTSSNVSSTPRPCVLFPLSGAFLGPRYVGKLLYTLVKPASPGGAEVGREEGKAARSCSKSTLLSGVGEEIVTTLSLLSCLI
jgi:hypothetical protein